MGELTLVENTQCLGFSKCFSLLDLKSPLQGLPDLFHSRRTEVQRCGQLMARAELVASQLCFSVLATMWAAFCREGSNNELNGIAEGDRAELTWMGVGTSNCLHCQPLLPPREAQAQLLPSQYAGEGEDRAELLLLPTALCCTPQQSP